MNYLLDTNVISELARTKPHREVRQWFERVPIQSLFLSVLTCGEIRKGIEKIADVQRKALLLMWLEQELPTMFHTRLLPITQEVADRWGRLQAQTQRTLPSIDALIAATALHYDMTLVTRNVGDFADCIGLELFNPFM